ncbi:Nuclear receptor-binding protein [Fasciola gigantica]|uniref:Nuclear receptor-binding protein n=1 Tax=Fasciola gigantica TaxID=46835 RepID=A0A504ZDX2_FASGI|nr:Nuclear receptor-binding protein [Fasciola gigantica]
MDSDSKQHEPENETPLEVSSAAEGTSQQDTSDRKDDDEEEEEEEEEDKIVEKSHNSRFHKRNKRFPKQIEGVDNAFIAIEPKSGKEVIWNECILSEKKTDKENRYLSIIKKLKKSSHPFLARFLDAWVSKSEDGSRKLVFITERLDECSLKQFLCNSAKNNRLWKRHVGQILSVLMFLHRLGITHGNLSKESIYYQNSGNLRVGPFALGGCLDHKSLSADIYALGVVALEIAIWTPTEFPQSLPLTERCQQMIAKLEDCSQRDFIEVCLDSNINARHKMKRLINHPAVTEVPILKLLSAKVIVENMKSLTNEDCPAAEQTGFTTLLKDYLSHYEDETIIVDVHFPHDNVVNSRSWKDFRSNFTLTSKFLEDFKNGFYPLFGCRWNWAADQEDDEDSLVGGTATANGVSVSNISGGGLHRVESAAAPSLAHSTGTSTVPSACVSRKHSNVTRATDSIQGTHLVLESEKEILETKPAIAAQGGRSTSLGEYPGSRQPAVVGRVRQSDGSVGQFQVTMAGVLARKPSKDGSVRLQGASGTPAPSVPDGALSEVPLDSAGHSPPPVITKSGVLSSVEVPSGSVELPKMSGAQANMASLRRSVSPASCAPTADGSEKAALAASTDAGLHDMLSTVDVKPAVVGGASLTTEQLDTSALGVVREAGSLPDLSRITSAPEVQPADIPKRVTVTGTPLGSDAVKSARSDAGRNPEEDGGLDEEKEDEEEEEEEDEDDDDEEDEEEDDDEKKVVDTLERFEPQTVHVVAPERAPSHPALFTHCQYFYIGAGRWQVYVQMWFVEDRLKREAYVQVFDYEWHDYERVADLFEASRCLNPVDRPSLVRLLSLARHNCALIDGDLQFPGPLTTRPSNFDVFELHEKLTALRLHQQAREQLQRDSLNQDGGQAPDSTHDPSLSTSGLDTGQPSSLPAEKVSNTCRHIVGIVSLRSTLSWCRLNFPYWFAVTGLIHKF